MRTLLLDSDALLRGRFAAGGAGSLRLGRLLFLVLLFGTLYGAIMGTFSVISWDRLRQVLYSASKVPLLLLVTFLLGLPSFFILNTLLGLRNDFGEAVRALLITQAGLTLILASLAPFTLLWYASCAHYSLAILFNALMFTIASVAAQRLLRRHYRPLIQRNPRHQLLLRVWLVIYAFVGIQMGWVLRPFVGDPHLPTQFFREESWGNAYVVLAQMIWNLLGA